MPRVAPVLLAAALILASATRSSAQVTKPRSPASSERPPAPATITAAQQPDGQIHVVWSAVEGAAGYKLIRSVPPAPAARVSLPNPSDTAYIDTDVKAGGSYYYVVNAVSEAGVVGLNASAPPVKAVAQEVAVSAPGDTGTTSDPKSTFVPPPSSVVAKPYPYMQATVSWQPSRGGSHYLVERLVGGRKTGWEAIRPPGGGRWSCCYAKDANPPAQKSLAYRVTALKISPPTSESQPAVSNYIVLQEIKTAPPVLNDLILMPGDQLTLPGDYTGTPDLLNTRWVVLDSTVTAIGGGSVLAKKPGRTYIIATGMTRLGAVQSWIWRVTVNPRPL